MSYKMSYDELIETATAAISGLHHLLCGHEIAACEEIVEAYKLGGVSEYEFDHYAKAMQRIKNQFPCEIAAHLP